MQRPSCVGISRKGDNVTRRKYARMTVIPLTEPADLRHLNSTVKRQIGNMLFTDKIEATGEGTDDLGIAHVSVGVWDDRVTDGKVTMIRIPDCFKGLLISDRNGESVLILPSREKMDLLLRDKIEEWEREHKEAVQ